MIKEVVVVGQGYVGLPLARAATLAGWRVHGLDVHEGLVNALNAGRSHVDDVSDADIAEMLIAGYDATTDARVIAGADVVVICVPTPLSEDGGPDLSAVISAARICAEQMTPATVVILESTTYPGTTDSVVLPILEAGGHVLDRDFHLAFSPERVNPGFPEHGIRNTPKLVGGVSVESAVHAAGFYSDFVDEVVEMSGAREAETAKLLENTYRHVNIALVNEMARFCHDLDIDIWEVIRGAGTKPFGFQSFRPGPGVGGHCIPIDPNYLSHEVRRRLGYPFRFVELAQEINNGMPTYVVSRIADLLNDRALATRGSIVLLLGVTYKPNIADQRESPAVPVAEQLLARGARLLFHDPFVDQWHLSSGTLSRVPNLTSAVKEADVVVLLQQHDSYDADALAESASIFFDTCGATTSRAAHRL